MGSSGAGPTYFLACLIMIAASPRIAIHHSHLEATAASLPCAKMQKRNATTQRNNEQPRCTTRCPQPCRPSWTSGEGLQCWPSLGGTVPGMDCSKQCVDASRSIAWLPLCLPIPASQRNKLPCLAV